MYYAHPLISYPSSVKVLSESPVKRKRSDCNKAVLTLLISLYGAFHLAAAALSPEQELLSRHLLPADFLKETGLQTNRIFSRRVFKKLENLKGAGAP